MSQETSSRGSSGLRVTPLQAPADATTPAAARTRERVFLERFQRNFERLTQVYSPVDRKTYPTKGVPGIADDPYPRLVEVLRHNGLFDPALLDALPHNRSLRYELPTGGWLRRAKPKVVVAATARSPLGELARLGGVLAPQGREPVQEFVNEQVRAPGAYHVLGVLSTVGWDEALWDQVPRGENYAVVLVEQRGGAGWRVEHSLPKELASILSLFDPEDLDEKVARTFYWVTQQPELKVPGGHLDVGRVSSLLGVTRSVLDLALQQIQREDSTLKVAQVGGREILKRDRY
ncbi:MAG: hypothetical protein AB7O52_12990 [Planctomycetota bacterium]